MLLRLRTIANIVTLITMALSSLPVNAASFQRMGIAPGMYHIAADGSSGLAAFCYDLTRTSPNATTSFANVLTDARNATVTLGTQVMSLSDAVSAGKVELHGTQATADQIIHEVSDPVFLGRLSPDERNRAKQFVSNFRHLSPDAQNAFLASHGNHQKIVAINKTNVPMTLDIRQQTVVGATGEPPPTLVDLQGHGHDSIQKHIWYSRTALQQKYLRDVGFYNGHADGQLNGATIQGITMFQDVYGLPSSGVIDELTDARLTSAVAEARDVAATNAAEDKDYVVVDVRRLSVGPKSLYHAIAGPDTVLFAQSAVDLAKKVRQLTTAVHAPRAYLRPLGFNDDQLHAFKFSVENANMDDGPALLVDENAGQLPLVADPLLGKGVKRILTDTSEPVFQNARYQKNVTLIHDNGSQSTLTVFGRTSALVKRFIDNLHAALTSLRAKHFNDPVALAHVSAADIVAEAYAVTARQTGQSKIALRRKLSVQFQSMQVAVRGRPVA